MNTTDTNQLKELDQKLQTWSSALVDPNTQKQIVPGTQFSSEMSKTQVVRLLREAAWNGGFSLEVTTTKALQGRDGIDQVTYLSCAHGIQQRSACVSDRLFFLSFFLSRFCPSMEKKKYTTHTHAHTKHTHTHTHTHTEIKKTQDLVEESSSRRTQMPCRLCDWAQNPRGTMANSLHRDTTRASFKTASYFFSPPADQGTTRGDPKAGFFGCFNQFPRNTLISRTTPRHIKTSHQRACGLPQTGTVLPGSPNDPPVPSQHRLFVLDSKHWSHRKHSPHSHPTNRQGISLSFEQWLGSHSWWKGWLEEAEGSGLGLSGCWCCCQTVSIGHGWWRCEIYQQQEALVVWHLRCWQQQSKCGFFRSHSSGRKDDIVQLAFYGSASKTYGREVLEALPKLMGEKFCAGVRLIIADGDVWQISSIESSCLENRPFHNARFRLCGYHLITQPFRNLRPLVPKKKLIPDLEKCRDLAFSLQNVRTAKEFESSWAILSKRMALLHADDDSLFSTGVNKLLSSLQRLTQRYAGHHFINVTTLGQLTSSRSVCLSPLLLVCFSFLLFLLPPFFLSFFLICCCCCCCFSLFFFFFFFFFFFLYTSFSFVGTVEANHAVMKRSHDRGGASITARDAPEVMVAKLANLNQKRLSSTQTQMDRAVDRTRMELTLSEVGKFVTQYAFALLTHEWEQAAEYSHTKTSGNDLVLCRQDKLTTLRIQGERILCSCGHPAHFLLPCRHMMAVTGRVAVPDIHHRWLLRYWRGEFSPANGSVEFCIVIGFDCFGVWSVVSCVVCCVLCVVCRVLCVVCRVSCVVCRMSCVVCRMSCVGCRMLCVGCRVSCVVCRVSCVVCRVSCVVCRVSYVVCRVSCVVCRVSCVVCRVSYVVCRMSCAEAGPALIWEQRSHCHHTHRCRTHNHLLSNRQTPPNNQSILRFRSQSRQHTLIWLDSSKRSSPSLRRVQPDRNLFERDLVFY